MSTPSLPASSLKILINDLDSIPSVLGLCAGFEDGAWRADALARCLLAWVVDWALPHSEREAVSADNLFSALSRALNRVYTSTKTDRRGEIGELLLHLAIRSNYSTVPAVSKIYFKDASNDTVKGFDAVHIVPTDDDGLEVWLGESKFYTDVRRAVRDVVAELQDHLVTDYLRLEFAAVADKIDSNWPYAEKLKKLFLPETSLDDVFERAVIPVMLTYDSHSVSNFTSDSAEYRAEIESEIREAFAYFVERLATKPLPREVIIRLVLIPLNTKELLVEAFDTRLKNLQAGLT